MTEQSAVGACPVRHAYQHSVDPALRGDYFAEWDRLRETMPVFQSDLERPAFPGNVIWYFTRSEDVRHILQTPELFSSRFAAHPLTEIDAYPQIPAELDPPEHTKFRRLLNPKFSPGVVADLEDSIRKECRDLIAVIADRGECEMMEDFAFRYPTTVFMKMMGLPLDRREEFLVWVDECYHMPPHADPDGKARAAAEVRINDFLVELIDDRRRQPREDLVSYLLTCEVDDRLLTQRELVAICTLLYVAGLDTVASMIGWSFRHLAEHTEDRRVNWSDPSVAAGAVEEFLRYYSILTVPRLVIQDTTVGGHVVVKGDRIFTPFAAANRDPAEFDSAGDFVIDREQNRHVAFGSGPHRCVGSTLARLELRIALEEWHAAIPDYRIPDGTVFENKHSTHVIAFGKLPLAWDRR